MADYWQTAELSQRQLERHFLVAVIAAGKELQPEQFFELIPDDFRDLIHQRMFTLWQEGLLEEHALENEYADLLETYSAYQALPLLPLAKSLMI